MTLVPALFGTLLAFAAPASAVVGGADGKPDSLTVDSSRGGADASRANTESENRVPAQATEGAKAPAVEPEGKATGNPISKLIGKTDPKAKKLLKTWVAVQSDVGLPDGLGVSAVATPVEWLRLSFGAVGNGLNAGVRGGVTFLPRLWVVRPTLTIDGGRIFAGDANGVFGALLPEDIRPMLQGVAWNFASARLGLEVGTRRGAVQISGGFSWIDVEIPGIASVLQGLGSMTRIVGGAPHAQMFAPSVRVGLIVALF